MNSHKWASSECPAATSLRDGRYRGRHEHTAIGPEYLGARSVTSLDGAERWQG
jgi:hypothetical protein